jgi:putative SOS response-associated peptidase YedK
MCGRFTQRPTSEMAAIFGAEDRLDDEGAHYNVAPTQRSQWWSNVGTTHVPS